MKKLLGITLGIMAALGGFLDFGQIVFTLQAGASFGYALLWPIILGTAGIIAYMEMCGRVAVVAKEPVFAVVRARLGARLGLLVLIASNLLNMITCAAELGGIAIILHLLTGLPEKLLLTSSSFLLCLLVAVLRFQWIERIFGIAGITMTVAVVAALMLHPDWSALGQGMLPRRFPGHGRETLRYWYFAVGIFSAILMEYEVHFYSSGALEEDWKENDLSENFMVASFGSVLGTVLTIALLVIGTLVFFPRHVFPETFPAALAGIATPFAKTGRVAVLLGALACLAGAAVETMLSAGYNLGQFYNFPWGKNRKMHEVPLFTASWLGALAVATILALTPVQPLQLVNISVIFGMVVMPLTYFPILRVAMDRGIMGRHANARTYNVIGIIFLLLITAAALAAIPLMLATDSGRP